MLHSSSDHAQAVRILVEDKAERKRQIVLNRFILSLLYLPIYLARNVWFPLYFARRETERFWGIMGLIILSVFTISCQRDDMAESVGVAPTEIATPTETTIPIPTPTATSEPTDQPNSSSLVPKFYTFEVVNTYPHDPNAFTQGLIWEGNGILLEGTGLNSRSSLRRVELETGEVRQIVPLPDQFFGEGITTFGDKLYQLTWRSNIGFVYNRESFEQLGTFDYPTEGWGITHDGEKLIMSDGSSTLYFWEPETLAEIGRIDVTDRGQPVVRLNELEYIKGQVFANVWQTDYIAIIDSENGNVDAWLNLTGLLKPDDRQGTENVLNGIAYDASTDRLFVTGKLWPKLFEIRLVEQE